MSRKFLFNRNIIKSGIRYFTSKNVENAVKDIFLLENFQNVNPALEKEISLYSNKKLTPVSLRSLMETGKGDRLEHFDQLMKGRYGSQEGQPQASQRILIQVACFLHRELPIRLAQRAVKLEASPLFMKSGKQINHYIRTGFVNNHPTIQNQSKTSVFGIRNRLHNSEHVQFQMIQKKKLSSPESSNLFMIDIQPP